MIYKSSTNRVNRLKWNPFEVFRQSFVGDFPADFSLGTHSIHIQFPLNCRLLPAVNIHCLRTAELMMNSKSVHRSYKQTQIIFIQRVFESNQYDNLSPPRVR